MGVLAPYDASPPQHRVEGAVSVGRALSAITRPAATPSSLWKARARAMKLQDVPLRSPAAVLRFPCHLPQVDVK
mgnify:CR=1 FL=1